jgi:hypothetical protein
MNIFFLSICYRLAAQMQCDRHVVKMILETAQLLCTAIHLYQLELDEDDRVDLEPHGLYKKTHQHHPMRKWVSESQANFEWALNHGLALCDEYTHRYGKVHKTRALLERLVVHWSDLIQWNEKKQALTIPPACTSEGHRPAKILMQRRDHGQVVYHEMQPRPASWEQLVAYYRGYYAADKAPLEWFKYGKNREMPEWLKGTGDVEDAMEQPTKRRAVGVIKKF